MEGVPLLRLSRPGSQSDTPFVNRPYPSSLLVSTKCDTSVYFVYSSIPVQVCPFWPSVQTS
nr:hypothetical protein Iba_chr05aCG2740 [Ipomoea batatas]